MRISNFLKRVLAVVRENGKEKPILRLKITIPYGRHSFGPQPEIVGVMPWTLQKARGSKIGSFCSIAEGLKFTFLEQHNYRWVSTYPFYAFYDKWKVDVPPYRKGVIDGAQISPNPIIIENDVWIGTNVTVKQGVRIGNGAVVGKESFVTKNVPPYAIVGGNPARIIKYRFSKEQIDELLRIAWWNWKDEDVMQAIPLLLSEDVDSFIKAARKSNNSV